MATKIPYIDETLNPITGCTKVSPGCDHCYAEKMAVRICRMNSSKYINNIDSGAWNGHISLHPSDFLKPFSWKKPRKVFICSMGDLFHDKVPFEWIDMVMSMIAVLPQHTFLVLTKRPKRMHEYFSPVKENLIERWADQTYELGEMGIADKDDDTDAPASFIYNRLDSEWPMKNLWIGVTAENQDMANYRIPYLLNTPAAIRFVSVEPMLTRVDLTNIETLTGLGTMGINALAGVQWYKDIDTDKYNTACNKLDWVICGCESGPGHRPMLCSWVDDLKNQCTYKNVPFFYKQAYIGNKKYEMPLLNSRVYKEMPQQKM
jgi:protein gp37